MPRKSKPPKAKPRWIAKRHADVADFCGVSIDTVKNWAKRGMPGRSGAYDLAIIVQWLRTEGPWRSHAKPEQSTDPLLDGEITEGLERYRLARAELSELELAERKGSLIARDKVRTVLSRWASIVKRMAEVTRKRFGADAAAVISDALSECEAVIDNELDD